MKFLKILSTLVLLIFITSIGFIYLLPKQTTEFAIKWERKSSGLTRQEIELPSGLKYVYLEGGSGEPLLLFHGFGANKENFTRIAKYLTPHYHVIIPDHIGFGESSHPLDIDYSPSAQVARLHELVETLGLKNIHLGGNSMGGQIAMTYAALYPGDVKSLWLLAPSGIWSAPDSALTAILKTESKNPMMARTEEDFFNLYHFVMNEPPFIPTPLLRVLAQERIQNYALEERIFPQILAESVEDRVRNLPTPSLIVWGDQDRPLTWKSAEILHGLLPNSQVIIMKNVGHVPMVERAKETATDYLKFRNSL